MNIQDLSEHVSNILLDADATTVLMVGGCVRDSFLGIKPKDIDLEVYGLSYTQITDALTKANVTKVDVVGKSFGCVKVNNVIDISIPRVEYSIGPGHKDYVIDLVPNCSVDDALRRRDFTINSIAIDMSTGAILDPFGGVTDIKNKVLCMTSPNVFREDPLRVLRGVQFASRFNLDMTSDTINACKDVLLNAHTLTKERLWHEWVKWTQGNYPSRGLDILEQTGWIKFFPALEKMINCPQSPIHHPEGNCFIHSKMVCDAMASICTRDNIIDNERTMLMLAALLHDVGKPLVIDLTHENLRCRGHASAGVEPATQFLDQINTPANIKKQILILVKEHMSITMREEQVTHKSVRKLTNRLSPVSINTWFKLIEADGIGTNLENQKVPPYQYLEVAKELEIENDKPEPLILGRHILNLGLQPGPYIGTITSRAYEAQLDGIFNTLEEGKAWLHKTVIKDISGNH